MSEFDQNPEAKRLNELAEVRKELSALDDELLRLGEDPRNFGGAEEQEVRRKALELKHKKFSIMTELEKAEELQEGIEEALELEIPVSVEETMDDRFGEILDEDELTPILKDRIQKLRDKINEEFGEM